MTVSTGACVRVSECLGGKERVMGRGGGRKEWLGLVF